MKKIHGSRFLFLSLFIVVCNVCLAQQDPPPMAMPSAENEQLIDSIIKVTEYEEYVIKYCSRKVNRAASEEKWSESKKQRIIKSIQFKYFNTTIYNSFAFTSKEELKELLDVLGKLNKSQRIRFVIINDMIQNNLDIFAKSVVEGKYL